MAARLARPNHQVLLFLGDGTAGINLMEVEAAVRQGIPFTVVLGNDGAWSQIRRGQVELFGAHGEYVERPEALRPALERAFASGKVAVINVKLGASDFRSGAISM